MSATGRNLAGAERHADDFYATPSWVTRAILPHVNLGETPLDPCAGEGAILDEVLDDGLQPFGFEIDVGRCNAAYEKGAQVQCRDALAPAPWTMARGIPGVICGEHRPTGVIMNPPFKLALEFVERALKETRGEVVALLRLAFLESRERAAFHKANPADVFVLAQRPSFVGHLKWRSVRCPLLVERPATAARAPKADRCELEASHADACRTLGTDAAAYAWFRWRPSTPVVKRGDWAGCIRVLDDAPLKAVSR